MGTTGRLWAVAFALVVSGCGEALISPGELGGDGAAQKPIGPPDKPPPGKVHICHRVPAANKSYTLALPPSAVAAHLAHGDTLGPCQHQNCASRDGDADGVNDCDDACAGTPAGQAVDATGCAALVLRVDAGPDVTVTEGDNVNARAFVEVVQGSTPSAFTWFWEQTGGEFAPFTFNGADFSLDTTGLVGAFRFRTSVSAAGQSASDEFSVEVLAPQVVHLAAGKWHNAALYNNGRVRTWGWGRDGQLGDGSMSRGNFDADAAAVHTIVVTQAGTAWSFGISALSSSALPRLVPGAMDVVRAAALPVGAALLQNDGSLLAFTGPNGSCLLGGATSVDADGNVSAIAVPGAPSNLVDVAAGAQHLIALDANGTAWVWGTRFGCAPRAVLGDVVAIAAGDTDMCLFVRGDGTAWGLGFNLHGQLGNGTTVSNYTTPRPVVGLTDVVDVAAGDRHSFFVTADGSLWAAGWNRYCQLGLEDEPTPAQMQFGTNILLPTEVDLHGVTAVAGGELHSVAVTDDGTVWAWGLNNVGQLHGDTLSLLPATVCAPMPVNLE